MPFLILHFGSVVRIRASVAASGVILAPPATSRTPLPEQRPEQEGKLAYRLNRELREPSIAMAR
ncbi:MAG TPA: hypothetical protein VI320_15245 [Terracidiphilus sp.]|jgi:hypothetical protein